MRILHAAGRSDEAHIHGLLYKPSSFLHPCRSLPTAKRAFDAMGARGDKLSQAAFIKFIQTHRCASPSHFRRHHHARLPQARMPWPVPCPSSAPPRAGHHAASVTDPPCGRPRATPQAHMHACACVHAHACRAFKDVDASDTILQVDGSRVRLMDVFRSGAWVQAARRNRLGKGGWAGLRHLPGLAVLCNARGPVGAGAGRTSEGSRWAT